MFKVFSSTAIALTTIAGLSAQAAPTQDNVLGLFLVKKDLITQQWRGEIYPIAQLKNGKYIDASVNVTQDVREDSKEAEIVKLNAAKSLLNQPSSFTAINSKGEPLAQIQSNQIGVGQFACESFLIGRGQASGRNLATVFEQLPRDRAQGFEGVLNGKPVKESWKWTIATQKPLLIPKPISVKAAELAKYRTDLVRIATAEINKTKEGKRFKGNAVIEELQTIDLDGDGKVEVYGKLRKGTNTVPRNATRPIVRAVYANIWLKYNNRPQLISKQVIPHFSPASDLGREYSVIQAIDLDQDGKNEVLIRNNGYEGVNFSIYQLQGNQLKSVFTGAGYGC